MIKSEPEEFSFEDLEREGTTEWTGVRNYAARINLNNMRNGDICLFITVSPIKESLAWLQLLKKLILILPMKPENG